MIQNFRFTSNYNHETVYITDQSRKLHQRYSRAFISQTNPVLPLKFEMGQSRVVRAEYALNRFWGFPLSNSTSVVLYSESETSDFLEIWSTSLPSSFMIGSLISSSRRERTRKRN